MERLLEGKIVLITGGASGIGRAAASVFAGHGASVIIVDRDEVGARETLDIVEASGGGAAVTVADVSIEEQVAAMVGFSLDRFGRLDGLFANAGLGLPATAIEAFEAADWYKVLNTNLIGPWLCMKYALPHLVATGGAIVSTASLSGMQRSPQRAVYGAAKAALINLTTTAAHEFVGRGVRVNAVSPGVTLTAPGRALLAKGFDFVKEQGVPMGRAAEPEEIAELAAFLLSSRSAYITGQTFLVDGGLSIK